MPDPETPDETTDPDPRTGSAPDAPTTGSPSTKRRTLNDGPTGRARRSVDD